MEAKNIDYLLTLTACLDATVIMIGNATSALALQGVARLTACAWSALQLHSRARCLISTVDTSRGHARSGGQLPSHSHMLAIGSCRCGSPLKLHTASARKQECMSLSGVHEIACFALAVSHRYRCPLAVQDGGHCHLE